MHGISLFVSVCVCVSVWKISSPQMKRKKNRLGAFLIWCNSS